MKFFELNHKSVQGSEQGHVELTVHVNIDLHSSEIPDSVKHMIREEINYQFELAIEKTLQKFDDVSDLDDFVAHLDDWTPIPF